jgi:hypothetical protein
MVNGKALAMGMEVVPTIRREGKVWLLSVRCPYCGKRHGHGGGIGPQPILGPRKGDGDGCGSYELVRPSSQNLDAMQVSKR